MVQPETLAYESCYENEIALYLTLSVYGVWITLFPLLTVILLNFLIYLPYSYSKKFLELENQQRFLELENQQRLLELENQQRLLRREDRRKVIERTFDIIHNGPLQSISIILSKIRSSQESYFELESDLEVLTQDIRGIGEYLKKEGLTAEQTLYLKDGDKLDLRNEIHELFYQVYRKTLERDFPIFKGLKVNLRSFDPIPSENVSLEIKRELCRFLEEAICNVGKHTIGTTSLRVEGKCSQVHYKLTVEDDGIAKNWKDIPGEGSKQARRLAKKLQGNFYRKHTPKVGTLCYLEWKMKSI